jgi:hypothetical protein
LVPCGAAEVRQNGWVKGEPDASTVFVCTGDLLNLVILETNHGPFKTGEGVQVSRKSAGTSWASTK